jgi:hypothetical protein
MIVYSWIALGQSDPTARTETDPIARSGGDRTARGGSDRAVWSGSDRAVLSHLGRTAPGGAPWATGAPVAMGITDDRGRAMKASEETLRTGLAEVVIIEAVRPGMAAQTLAPCYVRTGVGWVGRLTPAGEVTWDRFFL